MSETTHAPDVILVEHDGAVATVTVNRPHALNALDTRTLETLGRTMAGLGRDDDVRAIILAGAGDRAFVAGADIVELDGLAGTRGHEVARRGHAVLAAIEQLGKPVIAAIGGFALGGGCELAMACTLRWAADTAVLGLPELRLGIIPGFGGTQRLSRLVGAGRAMELVLRGRRVTADEAYRIGLVDQVVPHESLRDTVAALARELAEGPPLAQRYAMDLITRGGGLSFEAACQLEAALFGLVLTSEDAREGMRAFLDKRSPRFVGR